MKKKLRKDSPPTLVFNFTIFSVDLSSHFAHLLSVCNTVFLGGRNFISCPEALAVLIETRHDLGDKKRRQVLVN
jgi:hypothetical protein